MNISLLHVTVIIDQMSHWITLIKTTVWKFVNFCITQILREINFGTFGTFKIAILTISEAPNFDFW